MSVDEFFWQCTQTRCQNKCGEEITTTFLVSSDEKILIALRMATEFVVTSRKC